MFTRYVLFLSSLFPTITFVFICPDHFAFTLLTSPPCAALPATVILFALQCPRTRLSSHFTTFPNVDSPHRGSLTLHSIYSIEDERNVDLTISLVSWYSNGLVLYIELAIYKERGPRDVRVQVPMVFPGYFGIRCQYG
ncbi:hypothetical protein EV401DRAFT_915887 [Pisolithus croceorrhizus]|nr:hypothetical protein EV401DRAFT_915887 [Pisolithus croceorrhizus]